MNISTNNEYPPYSLLEQPIIISGFNILVSTGYFIGKNHMNIQYHNIKTLQFRICYSTRAFEKYTYIDVVSISYTPRKISLFRVHYQPLLFHQMGTQNPKVNRKSSRIQFLFSITAKTQNHLFIYTILKDFKNRMFNDFWSSRRRLNERRTKIKSSQLWAPS